MAYKVIDIYKDLPRRPGCSDCGKPGCFAFATSVHLAGASIAACPHLSSEQRAEMEAKMAAARSSGEGPREAPEAQAAQELQAKISGADLAALAGPALVEHEPGPREALRVRLLGQDYLVRRDGVVRADGQEPDVWIKVMLLLYLTWATGVEPTGQWVAFRDLPNSVSKSASFEKWIDRIGPAFDGEPDRLIEAAALLGGEPTDESSADLAIRIPALPRVPVLLLMWRSDEDFPARSTLLLDRTVMDYLDLEALNFLSEAIARRLIGESSHTP